MSFRQTILHAPVCAWLVACAATPTPSPETLASAYYGEPPTEEEVLTGIRNWMSSSTYGLESPGSLQIRNLELSKNYIRTSAGNVFGYLACYEWDAKQGLRGYGGFKTAGYLIRDGEAYDFDHDTNRSRSASFRCSELKQARDS